MVADSRSARAMGATPRARLRPSASARRLAEWMKRDALPFWIAKGWDERRGGFHERFFFDSIADSLSQRRVSVQWRQIYVLAHASELGWGDGLRLAFRGLEYLVEKAWAPDGAPGFVTVLEPDGAVADARRASLDHAYAITALSWLARATGDAQVKALLDLVMGFCESGLTDEGGFLREITPAAKEPRRQNTHMHMLEAMLTAMETLRHSEAALRAPRYRRLLERHFIDRSTGLLAETYDADWKPILEDEAFPVEPGHMAEWAWLIRRYERLFAQAASPLATHLLGAALRASEPVSGFLIDEIDSAQRVSRASRRLWPQSALIRAWLAQAETGVEGAQEAAEKLIDAMLESYLSGPFRGGWHDRYDETGAVSIDTVPSGTLYAIFVAAAEANRVLAT